MFSADSLLPANVSARPTIRVVALYDGVNSLAPACEALRSLLAAFHPHAAVDADHWSYGALTEAEIRHNSLEAGIEADAIIVADAGAAPLPPHVRAWITACLRRSHKGAPLLVALFDEQTGQARAMPALQEDLLTLAAQWRTPLLCNEELNEELDNGLVAELSRAATICAAGFKLDRLLAIPHVGHWRGPGSKNHELRPEAKPVRALVAA